MRKLLSLLTAILFVGALWSANAKVGDVLWAEDFSGFAENDNPSGVIANSHSGTTVYNGGSVTYTTAAGTGDRPKIFTSGGPGTGNNLLIYQKNGYFSISGIPTGGATEITLAYSKGGQGTLNITGSDNIEIDGSTISVNSGTTFDLTFKNTNTSKNLRFDDVSVVVKTPGADCDKNVTVSKGTPSHGDFSLDKSGELATCAGAIEVVVTPTPALHYKAVGCTATNSTSISGPDANGKYTVTYAQNSNTSSEINVTFAIKDLYSVIWNNNGIQSDPVSVYDEEQPTFPTPDPTSCDETSTTFIGWATAAWSGKVANLAGKTVYYRESEIPAINGANVEYFAVFAKAGAETSVAGGDMSSSRPSGWTGTNDGTYSGNGIKFNGEDQYVQSPDLSDGHDYKDVTVKLKAGYNGNEGSVLTIATLDADENVIASGTVTPTETYTSQNKIYSVYLAGNKTIKYVRVTMTSKTSNLGMKFCEIFNTPKQDYMTNCTAAGTCETPQFSIVGDTYNTAQSVTLSCATEGATIYYTTNGNDPTYESTEYSSAIAVNTNMTIKAIAIKDGLTNSDIATAVYILKPSTPTISVDAEAIVPNTTNYFDGANLAITLSTSGGAAIYYTLDGEDPTALSTLYESPFTITATKTIKAIAIKASWTNSEIAEQEYIKLVINSCATARIAALSVSTNNELYKDGAEYTIRGYVTDISKYSGSSPYFWIADEKGASSVLEVYKPTATPSLKVNDYVEVTGSLTKYNSTPEFAEGCEFEILDTPTAIDNTEVEGKAVKVLRNGILLIEKNGHTYNAMGQLIK